jgi:heme/copper-type cytochrome/quinol oxidase subunit 1
MLPVHSAGNLLWPTYVHLLVLGWVTQLIFGVAYWMFPRRPSVASDAGDRLGWATYGLFNIGLLLRVIGEGSRAAGIELEPLLVAAAMFQLGAGWAFVALIWPRVRGR